MIIKLSVADKLKAQNLEGETWYSWKITEIAAQPNSKKTGLLFFVTFTLINFSVELDGKEIRQMFFDKSQLVPLVAAVRGIGITDMPKVEEDIDTDELLGKTIDGQHTIEVYNGQLQAHVKTFLPFKSSSNTPAF